MEMNSFPPPCAGGDAAIRPSLFSRSGRVENKQNLFIYFHFLCLHQQLLNSAALVMKSGGSGLAGRAAEAAGDVP